MAAVEDKTEKHAQAQQAADRRILALEEVTASSTAGPPAWRFSPSALQSSTTSSSVKPPQRDCLHLLHLKTQLVWCFVVAVKFKHR